MYDRKVSIFLRFSYQYMISASSAQEIHYVVDSMENYCIHYAPTELDKSIKSYYMLWKTWSRGSLRIIY